ncbi:MAG: ATP-binding protein [Chloroflexota bacterium]
MRSLHSGFPDLRNNPRFGFIIHFIGVILTCSVAILIFRLVESSSPDYFRFSSELIMTIVLISLIASITAALIWKQRKLESDAVNEIKLMKTNEENLKTLVSSATEMLQIKDKEPILKYITDSLYQRYPGTNILFFSLEEKKQKISIPAVSGLNKKSIQKIIEISDSDLLSGNYRLKPAIKNDIKSGEFVEYNGGLYELFEDQIPSGIVNVIEELTGPSKLHIIGAYWNQSVLSWISILTREPTISLDGGFITAFVKQASIILRQKTTELTLEESEWQFRLLLNSAAEGIYGLDMNGNCIICNNKGLQLIGYAHKDEVLGKNMHELIHHSFPDGSPMRVTDCKIYQAFMDGKEIHSEEEYFFRRDGSSFPVEYWSYPLKYDEVVTGAVISFFDITEKKKVIAERQQNEANLKVLNQQLVKINSTKDRLFSIIAHDLRNPVTNMLGFTDMLIENLTEYDIEKLKYYLNMLRSSTKNTLELLDNLLLWSKSQVEKFEFKPEPIKLNLFLKRVIDEMSPNADLKNISFKYLTTEENECYTDPDILKIILRNLLQNALKFTNEGGRIEISDILINGNIQVSIKDNGVGMSKSMLDNLFNKDFNNSVAGTAREKGSGLGLGLCKEFVDILGGEIRAESELGNGSTFIFTIPGSGCLN